MDAGRERVDVPEQDRLERLAVVGEREPRVLLADDALAGDAKRRVEARRREPRPPDRLGEATREVDRELAARELAVGLAALLEVVRRERLARDGFERFGEPVEVAGAKRQARRVGVPAEAQDRSRLALRDKVERVAQVEAGDRPARAAQLALAARRS